ncbi:MAG: ArsR/SmtB family transcription factor [Nakamurella sp.]
MTEPIRLSDPGALAALAHPYRRRLMDLLSADGPSTVGQLAERTSQAVGSVSHHLKVLAAAGLIGEAPELARDRRERWWRRVSSISWGGSADSPAMKAAIDAASSIAFARQVQLFTEYQANREIESKWADAAFASDGWLRLTPAELDQMSTEITEVIRRWRRREQEQPAGQDERESVFVFARGFPARP